MKLVNIDTSKCERDDKRVVEGICLNWDMVKGLCMETMQKCVASYNYLVKQENETES
jgi:hypothetical protein